MDCIRGISRIMEKPIKLTIKNCWVVEIEDREETKKMKAEFAKPENSSFVDKLVIGLNPKASISKGIHRPRLAELAQAAGVSRMSIGDRPGYVSSHFGTAVYLLKPTITVEREVLFDRGRPSAFDDPEVRAVASKYGDPDKLLARIP